MKWDQLLNQPKAVRRSSLIAGYIAGETCSVYAIFIAHTMNPVSYRLVENNLKLRAIYGRYQEIYNWDGLWFTLVASLVVFALAWCAVRGIAEAIATPAPTIRSADFASSQAERESPGEVYLESAPVDAGTQDSAEPADRVVGYRVDLARV